MKLWRLLQGISSKDKIWTAWCFCSIPNIFQVSPSKPIGEFLYMASARGKDYIRVVRKVYEYLNTDTGEIVKSKDPKEFVQLLIEQPSPVKRTKADTSATAFEYICGRLRTSEAQKQAIIDSLNADDVIIAPNDSSALQFSELSGDEYEEENEE